MKQGFEAFQQDSFLHEDIPEGSYKGEFSAHAREQGES